jgi:hypothetical protein
MILSLKNRQISSLATSLDAHAAARNFLDLHSMLFYDIVSLVYHVVIYRHGNYAVNENSSTAKSSMFSNQKPAGKLHPLLGF